MALLALIEGTGPMDHGETERVAVAVLGDERQRRGDLEGRETAVRLGGVFDEVPVEPQQVAGLVELVEEQPHVDVVDRVQLELEGRDHPEVAAPASQRPEQVLVLPGAGRAHLAVGGDHLGREQVVEAQAVAPGQVADPAAQGEPGHTGGGNDPTGGGQPVGVGGVVEITPGGPAPGAGGPGCRVDVHMPHQRQVDDHPTVVGAETGGAVPAALDRQVQPGFAGEVHRPDDIRGLLGSDDHLRALVEHAVVDGPGLVVARIRRGQDRRPHLRSQLLDGRLGHVALPLPLRVTAQREAETQHTPRNWSVTRAIYAVQKNPRKSAVERTVRARNQLRDRETPDGPASPTASMPSRFREDEQVCPFRRDQAMPETRLVFRRPPFSSLLRRLAQRRSVEHLEWRRTVDRQSQERIGESFHLSTDETSGVSRLP